MFTDNTQEALSDLGDRIRQERIRRNDPQIAFAARIGVSIPTLRRVEAGDPNVAAVVYFQAIRLLWGIDVINAIGRTEKSLFDRLDEQERKQPVRKRARRRAP